MALDQITDSGAVELSAAIIKQQIDDYDKELRDYLSGVIFYEMQEVDGKQYRVRNNHTPMGKSLAEEFFDSDWFVMLTNCVGGIHGDVIKKARREVAFDEAVSKKWIKRTDVAQICQANGWVVPIVYS